MAKRIQPSDAKLEITQVKSYVGQKQNMRDTLRSLGLKRPGNKVVRTADPVTAVSYTHLTLPTNREV